MLPALVESTSTLDVTSVIPTGSSEPIVIVDSSTIRKTASRTAGSIQSLCIFKVFGLTMCRSNDPGPIKH